MGSFNSMLPNVYKVPPQPMKTQTIYVYLHCQASIELGQLLSWVLVTIYVFMIMISMAHMTHVLRTHGVIEDICDYNWTKM